jgi:cell division protein FtsI (penicillin-binding protein 3)
MALGVEPKLVIFTAVDEPKGAYYAADVAVPLFKEVLNATANRFSMPSRALAQAPTPADVLKSSAALPARMAQSIAKLSLPAEEPSGLRLQGNDSKGKMVWIMPALKGLTAREALRAMQGHDLKMEVRGNGIVRGQFPEEGKPLTEGETVKVSLGEPQ